MLKTVKKFAWLVACAALVFGAVSCSDPEDPATPATSGPAVEQPGDSTFESKTKTINLAELGVTAVSNLANTDSTVAEVSVNELVVTIVSKKAGTTTATAKLTITGVGETDGEIVITVAADGSIDYEITKPEVPDQGGSTEAVTYAWTFADLDLSSVKLVSSSDAASEVAWSSSGVSKVAFSTETPSYNYASTPAGLTMVISNGSGGSFNKINPSQSAGSVTVEGVTPGAIEPSKSGMLTVEVQGPFTAKMIAAANSSSDKTDRSAEIYINGEAVATSRGTVPVVGVELSYEYTGTDTVTVSFGGTNIARIFDAKIIK